jgi:hypothetical protein
MNKGAVVLLATVCVVVTAFAAEQSNTFSSPIYGISVTKPPDWHYATAEQHQANLERVEMTDEELERHVRAHSTTPLVMMMKYLEPYDDLNPSFKITVQPAGNLPKDDPILIMKGILLAFQKGFKNVSIKEGPARTVVDSLSAAYLRMHYDLVTADSMVYPTCSEIWIVPRGNLIFLIGSGTPQEDTAGARAEVATILASLKIVKE